MPSASETARRMLKALLDMGTVDGVARGQKRNAEAMVMAGNGWKFAAVK